MSVIVALAICVILMLKGCSAPAPHIDAGPIVRDGGLQSTTFDSPQMREALAQNPIMERPWYATRNDDRPSVAAGYVTPRIQAIQVRTFDYHGSTRGQSGNHYQRNTRSFIYQEAVGR